MARRTPASTADGTAEAEPPTIGGAGDLLLGELSGALPAADSGSRGGRARWRVVAAVLAVVVGAGVLVGGVVALVVQLSVGDAGLDPVPGASAGLSSADGSPLDPAVAAVVADFEDFARGVAGVSAADDAVAVAVEPDSAAGLPRGAAEVILAGDGWEQADAVAAALTGWTSTAEAEGRVLLDVRLTTADGSVDLSRDPSSNAARLAVARAAAGDDEVDTFWIGSSRVDLVLVPGAAQGPALDGWKILVADLAPAMATTVRSADAG